MIDTRRRQRKITVLWSSSSYRRVEAIAALVWRERVGDSVTLSFTVAFAFRLVSFKQRARSPRRAARQQKSKRGHCNKLFFRLLWFHVPCCNWNCASATKLLKKESLLAKREVSPFYFLQVKSNQSNVSCKAMKKCLLFYPKRPFYLLSTWQAY